MHFVLRLGHCSLSQHATYEIQHIVYCVYQNNIFEVYIQATIKMFLRNE